MELKKATYTRRAVREFYRRTDETTIHELIEAAAQAPGWTDAG